jgi:hypothetical protein
MSTQSKRQLLGSILIDENTRIGDLSVNLRHFIRQTWVWMIVLLGTVSLYLAISGNIGAIAFFLCACATTISISTWAANGVGVPLLPTLALQHLIVYGVPILSKNEEAYAYPESYFNAAGAELLLFLLSMTTVWYAGIRLFPASRAFSYTLTMLRSGGYQLFNRIGLILILFTTVWQVLEVLGMLGPLFNALPEGSYSIANTIVSAASMCGFFIAALGIGSGELPAALRYLFWAAFCVQCIVAIASLLLSSASVYMASVAIGLFWSSGRFPWRFLLCTISILSFLNLGKAEMRERYWDEITGERKSFSVSDIPSIYAEWGDLSMKSFNKEKKQQGEKISQQTLVERVNNLSNLLYVIDAVEGRKVPLLNGETYEIIPALLIPRIFWPEKPRTPEGQILLNVHFGRQDRVSSLKTYIAWGLLPEAYGNFGAYFGSVFLGSVLGLGLAFLERATQNKALFSMEGFTLFSVFTGLAISYEMVASVLVTSLFQAVVTICVAMLPFVERTKTETP